MRESVVWRPHYIRNRKFKLLLKTVLKYLLTNYFLFTIILYYRLSVYKFLPTIILVQVEKGLYSLNEHINANDETNFIRLL